MKTRSDKSISMDRKFRQFFRLSREMIIAGRFYRLFAAVRRLLQNRLTLIDGGLEADLQHVQGSSGDL